ncbi:MAG: hypothetical protein E4H20_10105, partial [Spirochaetales bacterium]
MKPIKLELTNIGPYVGTVSVDFSVLGDAFLVCGPTGSGKTMLFDAMTYALYGKMPGTRKNLQYAIVSDFVTDADEAGVSFEFGVGAGRWLVTRKPPRTVTKKRGTGTTDRPAEAVLYERKGGAWLPYRDRIGDVDESIEEILGLSADEFTKIVLLPQGEFQRFLEMGTKERADILEKIFPVEMHGAVTELSVRLAADVKSEAKTLDALIDERRAGLGDNPQAQLAELEEAVARARLEEAAASGTLEAAGLEAERARAAETAWAELDEARSRLETLLAGQVEIASLKSRLDRAEAADGIRVELAAEERTLALLAVETGALEETRREAAVIDSREAVIRESGENVAELAGRIIELDRSEGDL